MKQTFGKYVVAITAVCAVMAVLAGEFNIASIVVALAFIGAGVGLWYVEPARRENHETIRS